MHKRIKTEQINPRVNLWWRGTWNLAYVEQSRYLYDHELVVNHRLVGHPGHHRFGFDRRRARVDTANANLAGIRLQQASDHAERRGFSSAVRSKQRVKLSAMNGQR